MNIPYVFKKCKKCGEWKVASEINFYKQKKGKYGLRSQCKKCYYNDNKKEILERNKKYYQENKKEILEKQKQNKDKKNEYHNKWYHRNKDKISQYNKEHYKYNKEYRKEYYENNKEYYKEYYKENKDEILERSKEYRENNKDKIKKLSKEYREKNPEKVFNNQNKRRSKLENQGRGITKEQWLKLNDFFKFECAYSGIQLNRDNRSIDHIVALNNGGLNEPWNIVPMVKSYNSSKNKRIDVLNWYKEQEYFNEERLNKIIEWQKYAYNKWGGEEFGELILITDLIED